MPARTVRELQQLYYYRQQSLNGAASYSTHSQAGVLQYDDQRQPQVQSQPNPTAENLTMQVSRHEIVKQLNRVLNQSIEQLPENALTESVMGKHSAGSGVQTSDRLDLHSDSSDIEIDPADMAYIAECHGQLREAERLYTRSLRIRREQQPSDPPAVASATYELGRFLSEQGRDEEAEPLLSEAIQIQTEMISATLEAAHSLHCLANLYRRQNRFSDADPLFQSALDIMRSQLGPSHANTQAVYKDLMEMVVTAINLGRFSELNAGAPPLDLEHLSETYSWARPKWQ